MSPAFRSLRVRNYRLFAGGQLVSNTGTWMQRTAQDWLVLQLSHNSATALGVVTALQFLPMLLFGLYGGIIADRYDKRITLVCTQLSMGAWACALAVLDLTGAVALWHVFVLAFLLGVSTVFDNPVRQSFVSEMVGNEDMANAVSLNSAVFNSGRVIGPAIAGLLIESIGTGPVFLINALSYVGVISGLLLMRKDELFPTKRLARAKGQVREGLKHVRANDQIWLPVALVGVIGMFGFNFQITTALMAKLTFHRGAGSYGLLGSALAVGALGGALVSARRSGSGRSPRQRTYLGAALAFGFFETVTGFMPNYVLFALLLVPTGAAMMMFMNAANTTVQLAAGPELRGRVMGIYMLVMLGTTPIGAPIIGVLASHLGARSSLLIGGTVSFVAAVVAVLALSHRRGLHLRNFTGRTLRGSIEPQERLTVEELATAASE
jgi:MFS family permease